MGDPTAALPSLTLLTGPDTGRCIPLTTGRTAVLGRSLEADLTFPDEPSLSRFHARIERTDNGYTITDLGSANGTQLNGASVTTPALLAHRDVISCGALDLRFDMPVAPSDGAAVPAQAPVAAKPRIHAVIANEQRPVRKTQALRISDSAIAAVSAAQEASADRNHAAQDPTPQAGGEQQAGAGAPAPEAVPAEAPAREAVPAQPDALPAAEQAPGVVTGLEQAITTVPLFHSLNDAQVAALARTMTERRFLAGTEIVRQGDEGLSLYVILEGTVRVQRAGPSAHDVELATIGAGGFFGEMTLLDGLPRSATVRAISDVRCALLPRWGLEDIFRENPAVALSMLSVLSRRLRATERLLTH